MRSDTRYGLATSPFGFILRVAADPRHPMWMGVQLVAVRGLVAVKFLLAARLLGPELVGLVGIALLSLAIVESLSDTGLSQAVVQRVAAIDRHEAGAVWTLQLTRGVVLAVLLLGLALPISSFFKVSGAKDLIALAALAPLLRNSFNPGLFLVQRGRNFRKLSGYEALAAAIDLGMTLVSIRLGMGASSILLGGLAGDGARLLQTWTRFRCPMRINVRWQSIQGLTSFGKWIWGSSVVTLALNQFDKVLVARFLGVTEFGIYQVASRIAQLALADGATALGQFLYPTFAHRYRVDTSGAKHYLYFVLKRVVVMASVVATLLVFFAAPVIHAVLGPQWLPAVGVLRVLAFAMLFGAVIAVLAPYLRAIGLPQVVTMATLIQLLVLCPLAILLTVSFGAMGMAAATALAGCAAVIHLLRKARNT